MDQKTVVHSHNEILHSRKKEGTLTFCESMNGLGEHYAKWNKPVSERQIPYDLTYMWNLMDKNKLRKQKQLIDTENRLTAVRAEVGWGLGEIGKGIKQKKEKRKTS